LQQNLQLSVLLQTSTARRRSLLDRETSMFTENRSRDRTYFACVPGNDSTCAACWRDSTAGVRFVLEIVRIKPAENAPILGHANVTDGTTSRPRFVR
jgi:hypothetical protein